MFEKDDSPWGFKPHRYRCPICDGGERVIHISDMARPYAAGGMVCHLTFKCVDCYSTISHSIPITSDYAEELKERRGGITTFAPWSEEYPGTVDDLPLDPSERGKIKKRMEALGYF